MTAHAFRKIALGMQGAIESAHMGHPDFRANGRIFATLSEDMKRGMVKLTPEQQAELVLAQPKTFEPASGAWGRQGCTMVQLDAVHSDVLGEAMTLAWQATAKPASSTATKRKAAGKNSPGRKR